MRACEPVESGFALRDEVRIAYDVYGSGERTLVFFPAWSIVHSRMWKAQVSYFARYARAVTFDGRGNGRSDKSPELDYSDEAFAADALAVMDTTGTARATLVGLSAGARWALMVAGRYPERVARRCRSADPAAGENARSSSPHRSASDTRSAMRRSRPNCVCCAPISRSSGSRSIPSRRFCAGAASGSIPPAPRSSTNGAFGKRVRRTRLHAFGAIRRMDEILISNFMVFYDLIREDRYDFVVGDEAWDIDHFLHENPSEKRAAFVWLTDFVGWLPMPDGGEYAARITADYKAEMIEHIERHLKLRDRAIFVGDPEDIVPACFGPGLPRIREWTQTH